ncbi:hypothetical protein AVB85_22585 [Salmonella enterica subsp. enterica serovar Vitkin]|nr:hypothetical protein [Salmonella enterica]ECY5311856.1 hypothetical protein [Salmonella enterica subsp. enterica serovar Vitkin]EDE9842295.1 hypothetical protein [Salmonella enterica subsp. enterica serovar Ealing]EDV6085319.1 hypothetical protein [Salmonella enterica subsp. enterica serovar Gaminara]EDW0928404.1 hypothetical protein [Salmonella enterica subsp. enterica serovar Hvittingfoss]EEB8310034.1 hypothetical protein [Salmonella enterica subsp. enterica serovar Oslo]EEP8339761.1 hyp
MRKMVLAVVTGMAGLSAHAAPVGVIPSVVQATVDILYLPLAGLARSRGFCTDINGGVSVSIVTSVLSETPIVTECRRTERSFSG